MKALQYLGPHQLQFTELPKPTLTDNDVLLKIKKVGICGTDLHIYNGGVRVPIPLVLGHEFVGDVVDVGSNVQHVKVGDRAVGEHVIGCGTCVYCHQGKYNLCPNAAVIGINRPGALVEFLALPKELVFALPPTLDYDAGVLVEPLSIAVYAVRKAAVDTGQTVAVLGQGPIGLFVDVVAKANGGVVYGFDIQDHRLVYAKEKGYVDETINSGQPNALKALQQLVKTDGADVVFEAVGIEKTAQLALELARLGGKVIVLGVFEHDVLVNMMHVVKKELTVMGSWRCLDAFEPTIKLLATGRIPFDGLITHRYPFSEAIKAFEDASTYSDNRIKTVIEFD